MIARKTCRFLLGVTVVLSSFSFVFESENVLAQGRDPIIKTSKALEDEIIRLAVVKHEPRFSKEFELEAAASFNQSKTEATNSELEVAHDFFGLHKLDEVSSDEDTWGRLYGRAHGDFERDRYDAFRFNLELDGSVLDSVPLTVPIHRTVSANNFRVVYSNEIRQFLSMQCTIVVENPTNDTCSFDFELFNVDTKKWDPVDITKTVGGFRTYYYMVNVGRLDPGDYVDDKTGAVRSRFRYRFAILDPKDKFTDELSLKPFDKFGEEF